MMLGAPITVDDLEFIDHNLCVSELAFEKMVLYLQVDMCGLFFV